MAKLIRIPISPGELLDKISILEIKSERIQDAGKLANVQRELELLRRAWSDVGIETPEIAGLQSELKRVNETLWDIEDAIRDREREQDFGERFIDLARSVYVRNDERAAIKRKINQSLGSQISEEKSYRDYR